MHVCLILLVISTISTVSTVSSLANKHFYSYAHCPYHTKSGSIVVYHRNTHHPHHLRPTWSIDTNPFYGIGVTTSSLPLDQWEHSCGLPGHQKTWKGGPYPILLVALVIVTTKQNNTTLTNVTFLWKWCTQYVTLLNRSTYYLHLP